MTDDCNSKYLDHLIADLQNFKHPIPPDKIKQTEDKKNESTNISGWKHTNGNERKYADIGRKKINIRLVSYTQGGAMNLTLSRCLYFDLQLDPTESETNKGPKEIQRKGGAKHSPLGYKSFDF